MPFLLAAFLVLFSAGQGVAQTSAGTTVFFPTPETCLSAGPNAPVYQPQYFEKLGWWREAIALGEARHIVDSKVRCAEEWTVVGWRIVRWSAGLGYFRHRDGRKADPKCGNVVRRLWEVPEAPMPAVAPTSVPDPPPPPPPAPIAKPATPLSPPHVCAVCEGFESADADGYGVELDGVHPGSDYPRFFVRARFKGGPVSGHTWTINGGESISGETLEVNPESLEPGSYRIRLSGKDGDGHVVECETIMTVSNPPPPPPGKSWVRRHWKKLAIAGGVACVASAVISYGTTTHIPPCGWFGKQAVATLVRVVVKPNTTVISPP